MYIYITLEINTALIYLKTYFVVNQSIIVFPFDRNCHKKLRFTHDKSRKRKKLHLQTIIHSLIFIRQKDKYTSTVLDDSSRKIFGINYSSLIFKNYKILLFRAI